MIATTISGHRTGIEAKVNSYKAANCIDKLPYACAHVRGSKKGVTVAHRDIFDKMASTDKLCFYRVRQLDRSVPRYVRRCRHDVVCGRGRTDGRCAWVSSSDIAAGHHNNRVVIVRPHGTASAVASHTGLEATKATAVARPGRVVPASATIRDNCRDDAAHAADTRRYQIKLSDVNQVCTHAHGS